MNELTGKIAISKRGNDKGRVFAIVGLGDINTNNVLIADGVKHKIATPAKKNLRHLSITKTKIEISNDLKLAKSLKDYDQNKSL